MATCKMSSEPDVVGDIIPSLKGTLTLDDDPNGNVVVVVAAAADGATVAPVDDRVPDSTSSFPKEWIKRMQGVEASASVNPVSCSLTPDLIPSSSSTATDGGTTSTNSSHPDASNCFASLSLKGSNNNNSSSSGKRSPQLSVRSDSNDYNMNHIRRGRCIIINNRIFDPRTQLNERKGTDKDAMSLTDCFTQFNFDVERIEDASHSEIKGRLRELSQQDYSKDDCLVVCVLTHGDRGVLWARDSRYAVDDVYSNFTGDRCPTLAGKPKLFFIQACQGSSFDRGVHLKASGDEVDAAQYFKIPTWADILIAYSTIPGFYSWRNPSHGSWFIQKLVEVVNKYHDSMDLLSMLTVVSRKVAYECESFCPGQGDFDGNKQVPCITSMLTRRVFLSTNFV